jgi:hypothetical protein
MHKADGGCRSRTARITLCRVGGVSGSAGLPAGVSASGSHASRSSCVDSTSAATAGLRSTGGTAVARARRALPKLGTAGAPCHGWG